LGVVAAVFADYQVLQQRLLVNNNLCTGLISNSRMNYLVNEARLTIGVLLIIHPATSSNGSGRARLPCRHAPRAQPLAAGTLRGSPAAPAPYPSRRVHRRAPTGAASFVRPSHSRRAKLWRRPPARRVGRGTAHAPPHRTRVPAPCRAPLVVGAAPTPRERLEGLRT